MRLLCGCACYRTLYEVFDFAIHDRNRCVCVSDEFCFGLFLLLPFLCHSQRECTELSGLRMYNVVQMLLLRMLCIPHGSTNDTRWHNSITTTFACSCVYIFGERSAITLCIMICSLLCSLFRSFLLLMYLCFSPIWCIPHVFAMIPEYQKRDHSLTHANIHRFPHHHECLC